MGQLFLTSGVMSLIIIAFLLHRKFKGNNFSSKLYYIGWIIVAVRLILPFDISIGEPIYNFSPLVGDSAYEASNISETTETINPQANTPDSMVHTIRPIEGNTGVSLFAPIQEHIFKIWLLGGSLYFLYHLVFYGVFKRKLKSSLLPVSLSLEDKLNDIKGIMNINKHLNIKRSNIIDSPMIIGLINPILLIPENFDIENIDYIFRHELIHLKRRDIAYKGIIFIATTIHWFNPMVHIMLKVAGEDLELSCDEAVVRKMSKDQRILYCNTLLSTISRKKVPIYTTSFSGGKEMIKKRMDLILNSVNKKSSKTLIFALILVTVTASLLIGCNTNKAPETSADIFYQYKTPYMGDNSKVGNIVSNLDFYEEYHYQSISLSTAPSKNTLNIFLTADSQIGFTAEAFNVQSAMLFSLIDNLDEIIYIRADEEGHPLNIKPMDRERIDDMTLSVLGMKTYELGSSKDKFEKLSNFYDSSISEPTS